MRGGGEDAEEEMKPYVQANWITLFCARFVLLSLFSIIVSLTGCSRSQQVTAITVAPVTNDKEHDLYFQEGGDLIKPYMLLADVPSKSASSNEAKANINRGIALLNAVVAYNATNWAAWWEMGKGYQALKETDKACDAFGKSYSIQRENPDVAREYMITCLDLGRNQEAVLVADHAVRLAPNDAGLNANLALAYTLNGQLKDAQSAINKSLQIDPKDQISLTLSNVIQEVTNGRRPQPHKMGDLEGR